MIGENVASPEGKAYKTPEQLVQRQLGKTIVRIAREFGGGSSVDDERMRVFYKDQLGWSPEKTQAAWAQVGVELAERVKQYPGIFLSECPGEILSRAAGRLPSDVHDL